MVCRSGKVSGPPLFQASEPQKNFRLQASSVYFMEDIRWQHEANILVNQTSGLLLAGSPRAEQRQLTTVSTEREMYPAPHVSFSLAPCKLSICHTTCAVADKGCGNPSGVVNRHRTRPHTFCQHFRSTAIHVVCLPDQPALYRGGKCQCPERDVYRGGKCQRPERDVRLRLIRRCCCFLQQPKFMLHLAVDFKVSIATPAVIHCMFCSRLA